MCHMGGGHQQQHLRSGDLRRRCRGDWSGPRCCYMVLEDETSPNQSQCFARGSHHHQAWRPLETAALEGDGVGGRWLYKAFGRTGLQPVFLEDLGIKRRQRSTEEPRDASEPRPTTTEVGGGDGGAAMRALTLGSILPSVAEASEDDGSEDSDFTLVMVSGAMLMVDSFFLELQSAV